MSPPLDQDVSPQTPRNKESSTSLLAAFRNLTSTKAKPLPSSPSPAATALTSPDAVAANPLDAAPITLGSNAQATSGSVQHANQIRALNGVDSQKMGTLPGLRSLLGDLHPDKNLAQRQSAARAIVSLLRQYSGADVLSIWNKTRPLLDEVDSIEAMSIAYQVLDACVSHKDLDPVERASLFESVARDCDFRLFELRFKVLADLTSHGRNLADLGLGFMAFLVRLLDVCYRETAASRKTRTASAKADEQSLFKVFNYILDVIKCNSKTFTEIDLDLLINRVRAVSLNTTSISDLEKAIEVFDTLTTYSCLPRMSLQPCVELLCGTYAGVSQVKDNAWLTTQHLLTSHLGPATLATISSTLKEASEGSNRHVIRGACQLLSRVLQSDEVVSPPPAHLPKIMSAARQSLSMNSFRQDTDVLELVLQVCSAPNAVANVFNDKIWENIHAVVLSCSQHITTESQALENEALDNESRPNLLVCKGKLQQLADKLVTVADETHRDERRLVMKLLIQIVTLLEDPQTIMLIEYYSAESFIYTFSSDWHADFNLLLNAVFKDFKRSTSIRHDALHALSNAYRTGEALDTPKVHELLFDLLRCLSLEKTEIIVEDLCNLAVDAAVNSKNMALFSHIITLLREAVNAAGEVTASTTIHNTPGSSLRFALVDNKEPDLLSPAISRAFVRIFLRTLNSSAAKTKHVYDLLLVLAGSNMASAAARVAAMKLLFRLRADTNHSIFVVENLECEDIAALVCRTSATFQEYSKGSDSPNVRPTRMDDSIARRSSQNPSSMSSTPRDVSRTNSAKRVSQAPGRPARQTQPLWMYPHLEGLPEAPPYHASHCLTASRSSNEDESPTQPVDLSIGLWLEVLLKILQQEELEWEVYSYVLVHLGAQLRNHALFIDAVLQVKYLRNVLVSQLAAKSFHEPPSNTNLKKADAAICLYQILTMLISYRKHFSKNEEDDIVKMFVAGVGSGERSSEICIHALSMCCHELPASLTRVLEGALSKMSQIITQSHLAVHILEFLAGLARLPELFKNFRENEFKVVFGMCFRYLQDVRDSQARASERGPPSKQSSSRPYGVPTSTLVDDLPQYVVTLAYHVMTFWFIASKMQDRHKHIPWITKNLAFPGPDGCDVLDERAQVTMDMMNRMAFSDRDETQPHAGFSTSRDGVTDTKTYLVGSSILTVETAGRSGRSQITRRRPTGTTYSIYAPNLIDPPRHQVPINTGLAAEAFYQNDYVGVLPEHVFQQLYSPSGFPATVIHLPEDDSIKRTIGSFDRISPLDGHKVGIVYVGEGQKEESQIMMNVMGSADYTYFLRNIGTLCELRDAKFNTQGLDRSETEMDGKFTFAWRDRVTEIVFHVPTMMPNHEHDASGMFKKRHIGNDYVNIIFNNSGISWKIDNIPSAFNFINIVITPEARASFVETRMRGQVVDERGHEAGADEIDPKQVVDPFANLYYRVTVLTKEGVPAISPAYSTKIISGASLPAFVRLVALNASVFSDVWNNRASDEHATSSWRSRLKEIKRLHSRLGSEEAARELQRFGPVQHALPGSKSSGGPSATGGPDSVLDPIRTSVTSAASYPSSSSSHVNTRESVVFRRQSKPNIFGSGTDMMNRGLGSTQSVDMERNSSQDSDQA